MSISNLDNKQVAKKLAANVITGIEQQIQNQTITVSKQKMDIDPIIQKQQSKLHAKRTKKPEKEITIEELKEIKQSKIMEIREIEKQEDLLKKSAVLSRSKVSKSCVKLWKSNFTEQEMNQIRKIKKKQRQYERQLKKKEKNLEEWMQEKRIQDQELKKQYLSEQCEQRKRELIKQRQELQKKKKERQINLEEQIKKIKELKVKRLLHHQMTQSWKKYQQASQNEKSRMRAIQKERFRVNSKQIEEHQNKYLQHKRQEEKRREKALAESRSAKLHLPYIHAQIYYKVQKEEEEKLRLEKMKVQEVQNNIVKKKEYSKLVIDQFLPKLRQSASNQKEKQDKKSPAKAILNVQESNKLGNNYMRTAHQKITNDHIEREKNSLKITEEPGGNSVFYKDYLKDIKNENQKENKASRHDLVEQTLKNSKLNEADKLHKVRMILDKDTGAKRSDSDMVETLKSKIKVLNQIMH